MPARPNTPLARTLAARHERHRHYLGLTADAGTGPGRDRGAFPPDADQAVEDSVQAVILASAEMPTACECGEIHRTRWIEVGQDRLISWMPNA